MKSLHELLPILLALAAAAPASAAQLGQQPPIRIVADIHADPMHGFPASIRPQVFLDWVDWTDATLDALEPLGVQVSFLSCGEFAEYVLDGGASGSGATLLRRLHAAGGQLGSHSHQEHRVGPHTWRNLPPGATLAEARKSWADNISLMDQAVALALGAGAPPNLRSVNSVRGAHLPQDEAGYHQLMREFGFRVRQGGPSEDLYAYFSHYPMNPYQPSIANVLVDDPSGWFVEIPAGPVIGVDGIHKGIYQDFRLPAAQALFLMELINWRHAGRSGAPARLWNFGFAAHCGDLQPGSATALAYPAFCQWLADEFGPAEAAGVKVFEFRTQYGTGLDFARWRAAFPSTSAFSYPATVRDWDLYPYLPAPARELEQAHLVTRLDLGSPWTFAWQLDVGGQPAVLAWTEGAPSVHDFSAIVGPGPLRVIAAERDLVIGSDPHAVTLGAEPVIVRS